MSDPTQVEFTIDGYKFTKSIEDAETIVRDLRRYIQESRVYQNLPYRNGRLTRWDIADILRPFMEEFSSYAAVLGEHDRNTVIKQVWNDICQDADGRMYCPHCSGSPSADHAAARKDHWEIDIYILKSYVNESLKGDRLDDSGVLGECFEYLQHHIDNLLVSSR